MNYENRDPFAMRAEQQGELAGMSDWDKFAKVRCLFRAFFVSVSCSQVRKGAAPVCFCLALVAACP